MGHRMKYEIHETRKLVYSVEVPDAPADVKLDEKLRDRYPPDA